MRKTPILVIAVLGTLVLGGGAGLLVYDRTQREIVAEGITVGGIDIGGLEREAAVQRLRAQLLGRLREPIRVHHAESTWTLGAREARIRTNVVASVEAALDRTRDGNPFARAVRALTGGRVEEEIQPEVRYSKRAVVRLLDHVRRGVERRPIEARVAFRQQGPELIEGRPGLRVRASELHRAIRAAIVSATAGRRFVAHTIKTQPKTRTADLRRKFATFLHVNRGGFKLTLYKKLKKVKTYGIAVGQVGLETPAGLYDIANKAVNPAWHVPDSPWAGELAGTVVPPGPSNPIVARWLGIYDGVGIHGTNARGSIGTNASHGCIRMLPEQVVELYDKVPVGTPVYIA